MFIGTVTQLAFHWSFFWAWSPNQGLSYADGISIGSYGPHFLLIPSKSHAPNEQGASQILLKQ